MDSFVNYQGEPHIGTFCGPNSHLLFQLINADNGWLALPPAAWQGDPCYIQMASVVLNLSVVNDTADRCVKDVQDFANTARDGEYHDRIVLVSNSHWIKMPNFLKNEMENNF